jgi:energy-coupling factor transporter ATP-binding protein EcfA2
MEEIKKQTNILQQSRGDKWKREPISLKRDHFNYLLKFFKKEKKIVWATLIALISQGVFEIILILISHKFLKYNTSVFSVSANSLRLLLVLFIFSAAYLVSYYLAIREEKTAVVRLINDLRLHWFSISLNKDINKYSLEKKGSLLAKISYHLPMLSSGITNFLIGLVRWLILIAILLIICIVFNWSFIFWFFIVLTISLTTILLSYLVSKNYIVKEVTFYSKIIKLIDFSLSDWKFTKIFNREKTTVEDFNKLVELDSYFRVRREIWLRFGSGIIFVILIIGSWFLGNFGDQLLKFLKVSLSNQFVLVILFVYLSRILYESLRIGIYSVPFLFGLSLSVPLEPLIISKNKLNKRFNNLIFQSSKVKLFKKSKYYKKINFSFLKSGRYLVVGKTRSGKTKLAKVFSGGCDFNTKSWIIKADNKRFFYKSFFNRCSGFYYLDPNFNSSRTILEVALGREKNRIKATDLLKLSDLIKENKELADFFYEKADWRLRADKFITNYKNCLLLQALYCLESKPQLISIDNYWLDLKDEEVNSIIKLLTSKLSKTIFVFFSNSDTNIINFDNKYEI